MAYGRHINSGKLKQAKIDDAIPKPGVQPRPVIPANRKIRLSKKVSLANWNPKGNYKI